MSTTESETNMAGGLPGAAISGRAQLRDDLAKIRAAALAAVDPYAAVVRYLRRDLDGIHIGETTWPVSKRSLGGDISVLAVGKAAVPMAAAASKILGELLTGGVVITKYGHVAGYPLPGCLEVIEAGHPIPDVAGVAGGEALLRHLASLSEHDLVILLLSGGGSALLPSPVAGVMLSDLQTVTDLLLRAGANISELNAVRKHLSRVKGGQLARQAAPAHLVALVLSDVVGDPLDVIASGPTAPDRMTYQDAWDVMDRYVDWGQIPRSVVQHLKKGVAGKLPDTPKPGDSVFDDVRNIIIGSNALAAEAAVNCAESLGYRSLLLTTFVEGEAREVAKVAAALAHGLRRQSRPFACPACLVWGGETTVTVRGQGKGGRNQELALAAALAMDGLDNVALMALATDGTDGPTDAAGAVIDGTTAQRARDLGWDLHETLANNNAYPLLEATGDLLHLGPTGTNVNDLLVLLAL